MRCDATGPSVYVVPGMPNNRGETSQSPGGRPLPARLSDFIAARTSNAQRIVSYPPTAADFHTIKDGPPSTLCRHSARRLEAGGPPRLSRMGLCVFTASPGRARKHNIQIGNACMSVGESCPASNRGTGRIATTAVLDGQSPGITIT